MGKLKDNFKRMMREMSVKHTNTNNSNSQVVQLQAPSSSSVQVESLSEGNVTLKSRDRYQLVGSDKNFDSVVPRQHFVQWMSMLEKIITNNLYNNVTSDMPKIDFIRVILKPMDGVAHTISVGNGKEITISTTYLSKISKDRLYSELSGLTLHECTHVWQYNGNNTVPGYLIEAIADFERLRGGVASPTWQRDFNNVNSAYGSGAYFLDFIDNKYPGFVRALNLTLRSRNYSDDLYRSITGQSKDQLWNDYKRAFGR